MLPLIAPLRFNEASLAGDFFRDSETVILHYKILDLLESASEILETANFEGCVLYL